VKSECALTSGEAHAALIDSGILNTPIVFSLNTNLFKSRFQTAAPHVLNSIQ
jgi:hypothetical protein